MMATTQVQGQQQKPSPLRKDLGVTPQNMQMASGTGAQSSTQQPKYSNMMMMGSSSKGFLATSQQSSALGHHQSSTGGQSSKLAMAPQPTMLKQQ
jgi:hypothetical protein